MKNLPAKKLPKATHSGKVNIGGFEMRCYNLDTGERVLSREGFLRALGRTGNPKYKEKELFSTPVFLRASNLKDFISNDLVVSSQPIEFEWADGLRAYGYKADILPAVCYVYIDAEKKGVMTDKRQMIVAERCHLLIRGFATVGIIALIDEATGYQDVRMKDALDKLLNSILLQDPKKVHLSFPLELYKQWFRLNNWEWREESVKRKPSVIGTWTNKLVYDRIAPGVLSELKIRSPKNEKGYRKNPFISFFSDDIGDPKLQALFIGLIALAKANTSMRSYIEMVNRVYPKQGDQLKLELSNEE